MNKKYKYIIYILILILITIYLLFKLNIKETFINMNNDAYIINLDERNDRLQRINTKFSSYFT